MGDTNTDAKAAENAGVDFIFCEYGHGEEYKLAIGESAKKNKKTFADLISIFKDIS